jgi:hypothetical protein
VIRSVAPAVALLMTACGSGDRAAADGPLASGVPTREAITVTSDGRAVWASASRGSTAVMVSGAVANRGPAPLTITAVEPRDADADLAITGLRVRLLGVDGDATGDPNPSVSGPGSLPATAAHEVPGAVVLAPYVDADDRPVAELLVELAPGAPGRYVLTGLTVHYSVGGAKRVGAVGHAVAICAVDPGDPDVTCAEP